ncbi:MAG TPA: glycoside hydrolase family 2 TIM barrel-domain containing protein [Bacteroidales bacterium]|nr:glycoside hydrolase family 2 TIM barrel-domain containing protein [Bacteroidales bacterium]
MKRSVPLFFLFALFLSSSAQETELLYLSGRDKDNTIKWDFYCTSGMNSGKWSTIQVPSNWELQGFGSYHYGNVNLESNEQGLYRYTFSVPQGWKKKQVNIVFEGSMTDTEVRINGILAGPVHQGGFSRFSYNISSLLDYKGPNKLEVTVSKESANASINRAERMADYWVFGGIYRPVYLEALPVQHIETVAADARADGSFHVKVFVKGKGKARYVNAKISDVSGIQVAGLMQVPIIKEESGLTTISGKINEIKPWTPETPDLYRVEVSISTKKEIIHTVIKNVGFRTVELREADGIYVNGRKVLLKGVSRHTFWPSSGRTSSKHLAIEDVNLIKDMNMNAVRMSHYPPDQYFLDVCDSLGLFVLDELPGWQKSYDTITARRLVRQLVERDVNHPSIILWDNGNEGGHNKAARDDYALYDPQKRPVIEPGNIFNGVNAKNYPGYFNAEDALTSGKEIFLPAKMLNALDDGGGGSGLRDYWDLISSQPLAAGGFLWAFADEGVERRELNDSIDTSGNMGAEGILGPYHEKEASFYAIKEIWSPVQFRDKILPPGFSGKFEIGNEFLFTNLNTCRFSYSLIRISFPAGISGELNGEIQSPDIEPGQQGFLAVELPADWKDYDVLYITASDQYDRILNTWSWKISSASYIANNTVIPSTDKIRVTESGNMLVIRSGQTDIIFDKKNGSLAGAGNSNRAISLKSNELFAGFETAFVRMRHYPKEDSQVVEVSYRNGASANWTIMPGGWLKLDYSFTPKGMYDFAGITFSYPQELVTDAILYSRGPYRTWKNRTEGQILGLHEKKFNNTVTGQSWVYPEFKGYYSDFYAVEVRTLEAPFTIISAVDNVYLHLFTPDTPANLNDVNGKIAPPFPKGDISILHCIPPIGTRFSAPDYEGPMGLRTEFKGPVRGTVYFRFGE